MNVFPVMVTVDRSPQANYLEATIENLLRSANGSPFELLLADSGSPDFVRAVIESFSDQPVTFGHVQPGPEGVPANRNVAIALEHGAASGAEWVLFLEDDIDVIGDFFGSVERWIRDHACDSRRVYSLGANYPWVEQAMRMGSSYSNYPIRQFYGTQGFLIRSIDALSLARYLMDHCFDLNDSGTAYDIHMHHWSKQAYPDIACFAVTCPAFVQHIGMNSTIKPRENIHTFPSWPGHDWRYHGQSKTVAAL